MAKYATSPPRRELGHAVSTEPFTDAQFYRLCNLNMGLPVPLQQADLSRPFVYDRKWGVFSAPHAHPNCLSLLLAFHRGIDNPLDLERELRVEYPHDMADFYMEHTPGVAFKSSVSDEIQAWSPAALTINEQVALKRTGLRIRYIGDRNG